MTNRDKAQKEVVKSIRMNNGKGILALATGVGKTKITIDYINGEPGILNILWVVPTVELRDTEVNKEFTKWCKRKDVNLTLSCYNSIKKLDGNKYDLIVLDEGHELTPAREEALNKITFSRLLLLTATPPHEKDKKQIIENLGLKIIHEIDLEEALNKGLISDFEINVKYLELDERDNLKISYTKNNKEFSFFSSEYKQYSYWDNKITKNELLGLSVSKHLRFGRMRALHNAPSKYMEAIKLINSFGKNKRVLIYGANIAQIEKISKHVYHSETNRDSLKLFKENKINKLGVVNALNQGANVGVVDEIVIVQLNSNPRHLIQRIGRGIRFKSGHKCRVTILVYKDTVDEDWFNIVISNLNKNLVCQI
jgi:superfamily II DNA or RNA helicase